MASARTPGPRTRPRFATPGISVRDHGQRRRRGPRTTGWLLGVQDGRADAARPEMGPDRRTDEADRHVGGAEVASGAPDDLVAEPLDVGAQRVEDRQSLDRPLADELDEPLACLAPRPHAIDRVHLALIDLDDRLHGQEVADRGLRPADPTALAQ